MKIAICGSMYFAKEMLEAQNILKELNHQTTVPSDTVDCLENPSLNESWEHCSSEGGIDKYHFDIIEKSDAIVVLNYPKNNIEGYIGGATLMEIAIARHFNKKIFILHDLPEIDKLSYVFEVKLALPIMLGGDVKKINQHI